MSELDDNIVITYNYESMKSIRITHIKTCVILIDKYFYMCYYIIVRRKNINEKLFIKGSYQNAKSRWLV